MRPGRLSQRTVCESDELRCQGDFWKEKRLGERRCKASAEIPDEQEKTW